MVGQASLLCVSHIFQHPYYHYQDYKVPSGKFPLPKQEDLCKPKAKNLHDVHVHYPKITG
jgi:hypothetical protein